MNSEVFFIERDLTELATNGRPLSQKLGVESLYQNRLPLYLDFSDHKIYNYDIQSASDEIIKIMEAKK
jgi:hypothetical protein